MVVQGTENGNVDGCSTDGICGGIQVHILKIEELDDDGLGKGRTRNM